MKIRTYESFKGCMEVVTHSNFYHTLYCGHYDDCVKRLHMLENFEPEQYKQWLSRWKAER